MELENETNLFKPDDGKFVSIKLGCLYAVNPDLSGRRMVQQPEKIKQRGLTRTRRPGDNNEFTRLDLDIRAAHQRDRHIARQCARNILGLEEDFSHYIPPLKISTGRTCAALRAGR
jgi:hypothetical protein